MQTIEHRQLIDKSSWPRGAWDAEPDKVQWTDPDTGLPCLAVRHPRFGGWCGYVGVPPSHPAYGENYNEVAADVHGGLTFSGPCHPGTEEPAICHVPDDGEPDNVWWLGFDCAHFRDLSPGMLAREMRLGLKDDVYKLDVYRDLAYVRAECAGLAKQLKP